MALESTLDQADLCSAQVQNAKDNKCNTFLELQEISGGMNEGSKSDNHFNPPEIENKIQEQETVDLGKNSNSSFDNSKPNAVEKTKDPPENGRLDKPKISVRMARNGQSLEEFTKQFEIDSNIGQKLHLSESEIFPVCVLGDNSPQAPVPQEEALDSSKKDNKSKQTKEKRGRVSKQFVSNQNPNEDSQPRDVVINDENLTPNPEEPVVSSADSTNLDRETDMNTETKQAPDFIQIAEIAKSEKFDNSTKSIISKNRRKQPTHIDRTNHPKFRLCIWCHWNQKILFWLHLAIVLSVSFLCGGFIWGIEYFFNSQPIAFIDALFTAVSCSTITGLGTIDFSRLTYASQTIGVLEFLLFGALIFTMPALISKIFQAATKLAEKKIERFEKSLFKKEKEKRERISINQTTSDPTKKEGVENVGTSRNFRKEQLPESKTMETLSTLRRSIEEYISRYPDAAIEKNDAEIFNEEFNNIPRVLKYCCCPLFCSIRSFISIIMKTRIVPSCFFTLQKWQSLKWLRKNQLDHDYVELAALIVLFVLITATSVVIFCTIFFVLLVYFALYYKTEDFSGLNHFWVTIFLTISSFHNVGMSPFTDSLFRFSKDVFLCIFFMTTTIICTVLTPLIIRWEISFLYRFSGRYSIIFRYLLSNHHKLSIFLFPSVQSRIFLTTSFLLQGTGAILTAFMDLNNENLFPSDANYNIFQRFFSVIFHNISSRNSGFATLDLSKYSTISILFIIFEMRIKGQMFCSLDDDAYAFGTASMDENEKLLLFKSKIEMLKNQKKLKQEKKKKLPKNQKKEFSEENEKDVLHNNEEMPDLMKTAKVDESRFSTIQREDTVFEEQTEYNDNIPADVKDMISKMSELEKDEFWNDVSTLECKTAAQQQLVDAVKHALLEIPVPKNMFKQSKPKKLPNSNTASDSSFSEEEHENKFGNAKDIENYLETAFITQKVPIDQTQETENPKKSNSSQKKQKNGKKNLPKSKTMEFITDGDLGLTIEENATIWLMMSFKHSTLSFIKLFNRSFSIVFHLLKMNNLWILAAVLAILGFERERIRKEPVQFSFITILFECVSAFGNVGLSLGYPDSPTSWCGVCTTQTKLIIISLMLLGKHRGLLGSMADQELPLKSAEDILFEKQKAHYLKLKTLRKLRKRPKYTRKAQTVVDL